MKKIFGMFTMNPGLDNLLSDENELQEGLISLDDIGYTYPHFFNGSGKISSYGAVIIKGESTRVEYIKSIYNLDPNKILTDGKNTHIVFILEKGISKGDYDRIGYVLSFLYGGEIQDYHFYEGHKISEKYSNKNIDKNLKTFSNSFFYLLTSNDKVERELSQDNFSQYQKARDIPLKDILTILREPLIDIDEINNIHLRYGYPYEYALNYFSSAQKTFDFLNKHFELDFKITLETGQGIITDGVFLKDNNGLFIDEFGYYIMSEKSEKKRITDFYIKVYYKIVGVGGGVTFIVSLTSCGTGVETKKMSWSNTTSLTVFSDFIQKFGNYHFFGGTGVIKDLHKKINETKHIPTIISVEGYGHHEKEGVIIFKNGVWDVKEQIFTEKKIGEDYYFNNNSDFRGYYVTDKNGNELSTIINEGVSELNTSIIDMDDAFSFINKLYKDNTGTYLLMLSFGMIGYMMYGDIKMPFPLIFSRGITGCVDSDTEYLTPTGWEKISNYKDGEIIGEYNKNTGKCEFRKPIDYIKEKDDRLAYRIKTKNIDMLLTEEHKILSKSLRGVYSTSQLGEVVADLEQHKHHKTNKYNIPVVFDIENVDKGLDLSDDELRLMVAVIADGSFPNLKGIKPGSRGKLNRCRINIKKPNKIKRLRILLENCGIEYKETNYNPKDLEFRTFLFLAPRCDKTFSSYYWGANKKQLAIITNEVAYWDGTVDKKNGNITFSTTIQKSADFIQYAGIVTNKSRTSLVTGYKKGETRTYGNGKDYTRKSNDISVRMTKQIKTATRIEYKDITREYLTDGNKYCFTTTTGYFIARRNGRVFISGNSGKSSFNNLLQRIWGIHKSGLDFGNSTTFTMTIFLSNLIKFPYFLGEYRENIDQVKSKTGILRSVFDKSGQTKGKADQTMIKYDYYAMPVIDGEEMINDGAIRTRTVQKQFLHSHRIEGNFNKIVRDEGVVLDGVMYTYLLKSKGDKYVDYINEGFDVFRKFTSDNRVAENIALLYAGSMCLDSNKKDFRIENLTTIIKFQQKDFEENSTSMQIIKALASYLTVTKNYNNPVYVLGDNSGIVIDRNLFLLYANKNRIELTLKLDTYKEHLEALGYPLQQKDNGLEMVYGVFVPINNIHPSFLAHPDIYSANKRRLLLSK